MKIYSVFDPEFKAYGKIMDGMEEAIKEILPVLKDVPLGSDIDYVPEYESLQNLPAAQDIADHCYGGMPVQLGFCVGHNKKLNCLEYHRSSEFNLGTDDFILLLARQEQIEDNALDTSKVRAFLVPSGVLVEVYATTLHYAPCDFNTDKGFRVLVALPRGTNTDKPEIENKSTEDNLLWARNKWLIAHPESSEAKQNAYIGLFGNNVDISY